MTTTRRPQHATAGPRRSTVGRVADRAGTAMLVVGIACAVHALVLGACTYDDGQHEDHHCTTRLQPAGKGSLVPITTCP